jgi:hypothetical protein
MLIGCLSATVSADDDASSEQQLAERRSEYVRWIADTFGKLESTMDPRDGRRWALNQARLVLNRDLDEAGRSGRTGPPCGSRARSDSRSAFGRTGNPASEPST